MTKYIALTNCSRPIKGDPDKRTALVLKGETLDLTDAEAQPLLRYGPREGRQVPAIAKLSDTGVPRSLPPRAFSGKVATPPLPAKGAPADMPRPDPPGSSRRYVLADDIVPPQVPEGQEPEPGFETAETAVPMDAADITVSRGG